MACVEKLPKRALLVGRKRREKGVEIGCEVKGVEDEEDDEEEENPEGEECKFGE